MRIVHVITGLNTGGAEMMLKKVISETSAVSDHVVISLKNVGPVGRSIQALGVPVIALGGESGRVSPALLLRLARQLRAIKPDVVQAWMYHANFAAWCARLLARAKWPLYWSVRCSIGAAGSLKWTTRLIRDICTLLSGPVTSIIYNSHQARHQHEEIGYPSAKGLVIPNGFDVEHFRPNENAKATIRRRYGIPDDHMVIGHVARVQVMKDQKNLLLAAQKVIGQAPKTTFVLVGRGVPELAQEHEATAKVTQTLGDKLVLLSEQDNISELMAGFDVFVLCSAFGEGFPNVLGEALSCGTPCIATDVGDCALIVGNEGLIVPPCDSDALASAILKLASMPEGERKALGLAGRARMQKEYSLAAISQLYVACWMEHSNNSADRGAPCAE